MARKWIVREGSKTKGFRYKGPAGRAIGDQAQLERIDALRIPPAWKDVHILRLIRDPRSRCGDSTRAAASSTSITGAQ